MFVTLFLKEWKEQLGILVFGLGVLILSLSAYLGTPRSRDVRELLAGGLLILFFPFMALLLGASGFEPESRNDAWAYLFSRPVSKGTIWSVKYLALLSVLACLWLAFLGMVLALPSLKAIVGGFKFSVVFQADVLLLPTSLLISLFCFTVAFSLSLLSGKWSNILFTALFIGLALAFLAYGTAMIVTSFLRDPWLAGEKWLHAFRWGLILFGAALAGASVLTLGRADFSQPRSKAARFIKYAAPFLFAAFAITAAWTALLPRGGDKSVWIAPGTAREAYFETFPGIFKYDASNDKVTRIARHGLFTYYFASSAPPVVNGKMIISEIEHGNTKFETLSLWIMNADGSGKKQLLGAGLAPEDPRSQLSPYNGCLLSPDAQRIVLFDENTLSKSPGGRSPLWSLNTDGTGLRNHPVDPAMVGNLKDYLLLLTAWAKPMDAVLIFQMARRPGAPSRLWLNNLRDGTSKVLLEFAAGGWYAFSSPRNDSLFIPIRISDGKKSRLAVDLIDLATLEIRTIELDENRNASRLTWSPIGGKLAFIAQKGISPGTGAYVLMVVSFPDGKLLASKELTGDENTWMTYSLGWLKDGVRLILGDPRGDKCLKVLGPDLVEEKRIAFPASAKAPFAMFDLTVVGDRALVVDGTTNRLWRLDLKTERWKRIF